MFEKLHDWRKNILWKKHDKKWLEDNTYAETKSAIIHKTMDWPDEKKKIQGLRPKY